MGSAPLSIDVFVYPMAPYNSPDNLGEGEVATWAPMSCTLISGPTEGILIDAMLTFTHANAIAEWAKQFGKKITGIYITHGHSDHWLGLSPLLEHFPEAKGYAAPEVARRAAWEAEMNKTTGYWTKRFPGELPEPAVVPEAYASDEILVDGQVVNIMHVGQGDVEGSTIFHVPSADAVVGGDVVYNNVHMMQFEADDAKREAWIASIDAVAALNPKIVVAGHKSVDAPDLPKHLAASQQYLRDFTTVANRGGTVEDLVHGMLELHGERDQQHTLWISARAEVARRA
ncbi:MBL fold metallo-hydrolase [Dactylosporangium sp. NPDC051485]|uniref:MBL fold metallo-hydrolase n=1 Tax=Dactylosporangium sp. NPDC051485 TaxID=3154846 RepID=UPI00343CE5C0